MQEIGVWNTSEWMSLTEMTLKSIWLTHCKMAWFSINYIMGVASTRVTPTDFCIIWNNSKSTQTKETLYLQCV